MSFRWETELRDSFHTQAMIRDWVPSKKHFGTVTVYESKCSDGRADLVWANVPSIWADTHTLRTAKLLQQPTCSRILSLLKPRAIRRESFLRTRIGVAYPTLRYWLNELIDTVLVDDLGGGRFRLGALFSIPEIDIHAFEFKLKDWKRAFYQATRYRTFSHRVYVVIPPKLLPSVMANFHMFVKFNIGLFIHDSEGNSKRVLASRRRKPTSRQHFIRALGMIVAKVVKERPGS